MDFSVGVYEYIVLRVPFGALGDDKIRNLQV